MREVQMSITPSDERRYWLVVIGEENFRILEGMGHPYYALRVKPKRLQSGDICVLYRSGSNRGLVGTFEVTQDPARRNLRVGYMNFSVCIPWRPLLLLGDDAARLDPIVQKLDFIQNKERWSTYMQTTFREIPSSDYETMKAHISDQKKRARGD